MPFEINSFLANIDQGSIAKTSNFEVLITREKGGNQNEEYDMVMRIETVNLPGRSVKLSSEEVYHYGLDERRATGSTMGEISINIICSEDYRERDYFDRWLDDMVGPYRTLQGSAPNMYDVGYYDDYKGTVEITCYTDDGQIGRRVQLIDATPTSVGNIEMDWSQTNIAKLAVSFSYVRYIDTTEGTTGARPSTAGQQHAPVPGAPSSPSPVTAPPPNSGRAIV